MIANGKTIVLLLLFLGLLTPLFAQAETHGIPLNLDYPPFFGIDLATKEGQSLENIIAWFYAFIVGIAGLAAFAMIVWGGVQWMTSAGNPTKTSDAKDRIQKALLGLLLILSSFVILRVINPELTTLRITGLPPVECPKDTRGECISFESPAFLTANGSKDSVLIAPDEQVTLRWVIPGVQTCQASSSPAEIWVGEKPTGGTDSFDSLPEGYYRFYLECPPSTKKTVAVIVSSGEITDETEPTVELLANGFPGPLTLSSDELPNALVDFSWEVTNAHQCIGGDELTLSSTELEQESASQILSTTNGEHHYTITCTNLNNAKSASDTVIITVDL